MPRTNLSPDAQKQASHRAFRAGFGILFSLLLLGHLAYKCANPGVFAYGESSEAPALTASPASLAEANVATVQWVGHASLGVEGNGALSAARP